MSEIEVRTTGAEEASEGIVELWRGGEQIAYEALLEVERVLS